MIVDDIQQGAFLNGASDDDGVGGGFGADRDNGNGHAAAAFGEGYGASYLANRLNGDGFGDFTLSDGNFFCMPVTLWLHEVQRPRRT